MEIAISGPVKDAIIVDSREAREWEFDFAVPSDCETGCEVVFGVGFRHVSGSGPPTLSWDAGVVVVFSSESRPAAANDMTMERILVERQSG